MMYYIDHLGLLSVLMKAIRKHKGICQADMKKTKGILPKTLSALESHSEHVTMEGISNSYQLAIECSDEKTTV